jgi:membrane protein DedA with SNARE-associated domain
MLEQLSGIIIHLIQSTGYFGVFILMALESALIPIPSEVTMPFAGFLVQQGKLNLYLVIFIGAFANLVGSLVAYAIGYFLEETVILKLIDKYGKFILVTRKEYEHSMHWFRKYGDSVAFFSRILPAVRTFISLPAGLSEMNVWKFSLFTFLGSLIWSTFLTYVGVYFGRNWAVLEPYFRKFNIALVVLFVLAVLWYINHKLKIVKLKKS